MFIFSSQPIYFFTVDVHQDLSFYFLPVITYIQTEDESALIHFYTLKKSPTYLHRFDMIYFLVLKLKLINFNIFIIGIVSAEN